MRVSVHSDTSYARVGIDITSVSRIAASKAIGRDPRGRVWTPEEKLALARHTNADLFRAIAWAVKESVIKQRGARLPRFEWSDIRITSVREAPIESHRELEVLCVAFDDMGPSALVAGTAEWFWNNSHGSSYWCAKGDHVIALTPGRSEGRPRGMAQ